MSFFRFNTRGIRCLLLFLVLRKSTKPQLSCSQRIFVLRKKELARSISFLKSSKNKTISKTRKFSILLLRCCSLRDLEFALVIIREFFIQGRNFKIWVISCVFYHPRWNYMNWFQLGSSEKDCGWVWRQRYFRIFYFSLFLWFN